jgi:hypothetical protein
VEEKGIRRLRIKSNCFKPTKFTRKMFRNFLFLLLTVWLTACKPQEISRSPGYEYFPLHTGQYADFEVTKTKFALTDAPETEHFLIRHTVRDSMKNASGQIVFYIEYATWTANNTWKIDSVSTIWKTVDRAFGIESGRTIVKLAFPLSERNVWNGNAYNNLGDARFEESNIGKSMEIDSVLFPKTVTVIRQDEKTLIRQKKYTEIYAEGIGLIRKELIYVNFCYDSGCVGKEKITSGWKEISIIKKFGR